MIRANLSDVLQVKLTLTIILDNIKFCLHTIKAIALTNRSGMPQHHHF